MHFSCCRDSNLSWDEYEIILIASAVRDRTWLVLLANTIEITPSVSAVALHSVPVESVDRSSTLFTLHTLYCVSLKSVYKSSTLLTLPTLLPLSASQLSTDRRHIPLYHLVLCSPQKCRRSVDT